MIKKTNKEVDTVTEAEKSIRKELFSMKDDAYREFQCRLMPTVEKERIIGIRTPRLRLYAKTLSASPLSCAFLSVLPHEYYEENNLHAFLIEQIKDFREAVSALDAFLPYVDNWATCDMMRPKVFGKHLPELLVPIRRWISSKETYAVRFGIEMLMTFYLDGVFKDEYPALVASVKSEEYYINMMIAWYFATALAKQYEATLPYLKENRLALWTHNKTISKAVESFRISSEQKEQLRALKRK